MVEIVIFLRTRTTIEQFYVNRFQNVNYKMSVDNGGLNIITALNKKFYPI